MQHTYSVYHNRIFAAVLCSSPKVCFVLLVILGHLVYDRIKTKSVYVAKGSYKAVPLPGEIFTVRSYVVVNIQ